MNKNIFWNKLNRVFEQSKDADVGIVGESLGYIDKNGNGVEVDYKSWGVKDFNELLSLLKSLSCDNLINLINTNNMGYFIEKK